MDFDETAALRKELLHATDVVNALRLRVAEMDTMLKSFQDENDKLMTRLKLATAQFPNAQHARMSNASEKI